MEYVLCITLTKGAGEADNQFEEDISEGTNPKILKQDDARPRLLTSQYTESMFLYLYGYLSFVFCKYHIFHIHI